MDCGSRSNRVGTGKPWPGNRCYRLEQWRRPKTSPASVGWAHNNCGGESLKPLSQRYMQPPPCRLFRVATGPATSSGR